MTLPCEGFFYVKNLINIKISIKNIEIACEYQNKEFTFVKPKEVQRRVTPRLGKGIKKKTGFETLKEKASHQFLA